MCEGVVSGVSLGGLLEEEFRELQDKYYSLKRCTSLDVTSSSNIMSNSFATLPIHHKNKPTQ